MNNNTVEDNNEIESNTTENVEVNVETNGNLETQSLEDFVDITEPIDEEEEVNQETTEETTNETEGDEEEATEDDAKLCFSERAENMGLTSLGSGTFHYGDSFCEVAYKNIQTLEGETGVVDGLQLQTVALFTKGMDDDAVWKHQGMLSDSYKFLGNGALIDQIKESITGVGDAELAEQTFMAANLCEIRHDIVVKNGNDIAEVGSLFPMMSIKNTYNGSGATKVTFGMCVAEDDSMSNMTSEKFGVIRQIHLDGATSELATQFGAYANVFNDNIDSVVTENFETEVTPDMLLELLDTIQTKVGKSRREAFSTIVSPEEGQEFAMNNWQLFLALTRFTTVEKNINQKKVLENVAESVLVLPAQMMQALAEINA